MYPYFYLAMLLVSKYYYAMRKTYLLLIPLIIWGCEQTYDNVIDTSTENYQVSSIAGVKDSLNLYQFPGDSLLNLKIIFTPESEVNKAYFDIFSSDYSRLNLSPVEMLEDSLNEFKNQFILNNKNPNGVYTIKYSATGLSGKNKQVAESNFYFINGQDTLPPVISNLNMPDTIQAGETIVFTIEVSDSNGLNDIEFVFYEAYDPDGNRIVNTQGIYQFPMFDDGDTQANGDVTAGDGIYSVRLTFPQNVQLGIWRFQFQAEDHTGALSNIINHYMLIQ
jgi:hypothetical protein